MNTQSFIKDSEIEVSKSAVLPKICLSMIVKNEAHVILETLACVVKYIGYYVICDTGSTDNTEEVIKKFFDEYGIQGEIKHHDWKDNFGYSRTLALNECLGKSEYIWIIDADDVIVGNLVLPELVDHSYSLQIGKGFTYSRPFIIKNDSSLGWQFRLPLHEYLCSKIHTNASIDIVGDYYLDSRRLGDRSKNPNKYLKDAIILKNFLPEAGEDYNRCVFYMANSYFDHAGMHQSEEHMLNALNAYEQRINLGGWYEEVYYSWYRSTLAIRFLMERGNKNYNLDKLINAGVQGYGCCKERVESLTELIKYLNIEKKYNQAYKYAKIAFGDNFSRGSVPLPKYSKLFIHETMYIYELAHEFVFAAINLGKFIEAHQIISGTLRDYSSRMHSEWIKIFNANKQTCIKNFDKSKNLNCLLYLGSYVNTVEINKIITMLKMQYNVYVVSEIINRSILSQNKSNASERNFQKNIIFINTDSVTEIRKKIKFNQCYLLDNVNILLHKSY